MLGTKYIVKRGDTLWDISGRFLGNPSSWPEIYQHNNKPPVVTATGSKIANPDLIFVGQVIYIPGGPPRPNRVQPPRPPSAKPPPPRPAASGQPKVKAKRKVRSIPFKYELSDLPSVTVVSPTHIATVKLKGSVTIQSEQAFDFVAVSQKSFEVLAKRETDLVLGKLVSETKVGWNPATNQISFENGITIHSTNKYAPSTSASVALSSATGLPVAKASIAYPPIKGRFSQHAYVTRDLGVEIELTPLPPRAKPRPVPSAKPRPVPASGPSAWDYLVPIALVTAATVLVAATIAEDVITMGAGIADDAASFAAASALFAAGVGRLQRAPGTTPIVIEGAGKPPPQL